MKEAFGFPRKNEGPHLPFDLLFQHFREVLDSKNKAIETIAGMADTLGGDYLFDTVYLEKTYGDLYDAMQETIRRFGYLTGNRYPELGALFSRIDGQIRPLIEGVSPPSAVLVVPFSGVTWDMARFIGGKNAALAELVNEAHLNVPQGFAITTGAFDEFMRHNRLEARLSALEGGAVSEEALLELQEAIGQAEIAPSVLSAIEKELVTLRGSEGDGVLVAVRSSAEEEDSEYSFAGQFETVLNVLPDPESVAEAYKRVVASLYTPKSAVYQQQAGYDIRTAKMAACCIRMVEAVSSGVAYTRDPLTGDDTLLINSAWGLGSSIVEGQVDADAFSVAKQPPYPVLRRKTGEKRQMVVRGPRGGTETIGVSEPLRQESSLTDQQIADLAAEAVRCEKHFRKPLDIEWAIDRSGALFVLQARPLRLPGDLEAGPGGGSKQAAAGVSGRPLIRGRGTIVQKGAGAGRVFFLKRMEDLGSFPRGAVLVARNDSSEFIRAIPYAAAIVTDVGTPTSHMSSLCREFRVPTLVNAGNATQLLVHGQEVTVSLGDDGDPVVYEGIVREALDAASAYGRRMDDVYEFRKKRYILRYISPLNLIDPLIDNFAPSGCRTMHDILRFIHEKAVAELVEKARYSDEMVKKHAAVRLDAPIPLDIIVVDIGGGLDIAADSSQTSVDRISSAPLREIMRGMTHPGIWRSEATSLHVTDFLSSMMRMPDITADTGDHVVYNIAIVSGEYMNLSLRLGYHFNMIDCYCSDNVKNNHIYFRFVGGATDMTKRSRRVQLLAGILKEFGFNINTRGDLIIGRIANLPKSEMEGLLEQLGRLIAYTRQLDAQLHDDASIDRYVADFLAGRYDTP